MTDQNGPAPQLFPEEVPETTEDEVIEEASAPELPTSNDGQTSGLDAGVQAKAKRRSVQRSFPAVPFEEALELPLAIQRLASGHRVRRLRLFELLQRSPDSGPSRALITNSTRYNLTTGSYAAEWLELTEDGRTGTSDEVPEREKIRVRFKLAIEEIPPFKLLHEQFVNGRLPAKSVMADFLKDKKYHNDEVAECVDTFLLNAKFIGILQSISGAERLVPIDYVLDYAPAGVQQPKPVTSTTAQPQWQEKQASLKDVPLSPNDARTENGEDWEHICFYVTPIGSDGSEQRLHADLLLGSIVEPALEELGLKVVRADKIASPGIITRQVIEHIMQARLVVADLSFHNPNVFYELALRHASGLPTVQVIRASDSIPFDVDQMRTIKIDTSSIYTLVPQLDVHRAAIASQARRALEDTDTVDNPFTAFYPPAKIR